MINCLVRSLRRRRPSIRGTLAGADLDGTSTASDMAALRRRRKHAVDRTDPYLAALVEGQAMELPHASPAFEIDERLQRDQQVAAVTSVRLASSRQYISSIRLTTASRINRIRAVSSCNLPALATTTRQSGSHCSQVWARVSTCDLRRAGRSPSA